MKPACCQGLDVIVGRERRFVVGTIAFDLLGAESKKYLVLHVDDPAGLVAHEKGKGTAWLTSTLVPDFVENKIYNEVAKKLREEFKAKGSPVSVEITQVPPKGGPTTNDLLTGAAIGGGLAALVYLVVRLLRRRA